MTARHSIDNSAFAGSVPIRRRAAARVAIAMIERQARRAGNRALQQPAICMTLQKPAVLAVFW